MNPEILTTIAADAYAIELWQVLVGCCVSWCPTALFLSLVIGKISKYPEKHQLTETEPK